jgi:hypothetical protein
MVSRCYRAGASGSGCNAAYRSSRAVYRAWSAANRHRRRGGAQDAADWSTGVADGSGLSPEGRGQPAPGTSKVLWTVWASWALTGQPFFLFFL